MVCKSSDSSDGRWAAIPIDLDALHKIVCEIFRVPSSHCGPPVAIGLHGRYSRVFSFQLPTRKVVARLMYPIKPLFKTEAEVCAMDFVRSHTSLPVPEVFLYCSEATNPVGTEWVIMEYMSGVEMDEAWKTLGLPQKGKLALDLIDLHDQFLNFVDDFSLHDTRAPRWAPSSLDSLASLKAHCNHLLKDNYSLGPLNDISNVNHTIQVPSPSQTMPVYSSDEYVKLLGFNGNPSARDKIILPTHEKCVELFQSVYRLYPNSTVLGPGESTFHFSHGDLHGENILVDPQSGSITAIIDWELAAFRPLWTQPIAVEWFGEDIHRFVFGGMEPENFEYDTPEAAELRAFFRVNMNKINPDLFLSFLGAIELRAVLDAATDVPMPNGDSDIFLWKYYDDGYWKEDRRGPFPWDMEEWTTRRLARYEPEVAAMSLDTSATVTQLE